MSDWRKSDGAKIKIEFDRPIISGQVGNESHFTITVPEYNYVPDGILRNVTKAVKETYAYGTFGDVDLDLGDKTNVICVGGKLSLGVMTDG